MTMTAEMTDRMLEDLREIDWIEERRESYTTCRHAVDAWEMVLVADGIGVLCQDCAEPLVDAAPGSAPMWPWTPACDVPDELTAVPVPEGILLGGAE